MQEASANRGRLQKNSHSCSVPTYTTASNQSLLGVPVVEANLLFLNAQGFFEPVVFQLYVNGFTYTNDLGDELSMSVTPFTLVRHCKFQSGECAHLKCFKISLMETNPILYFAVPRQCETEADQLRIQYVQGISNAILLVTHSLLSTCPFVCDPLPSAPHTAPRLLAGYLLYRTHETCISVVYCELQSQVNHRARLIFYSDHTCMSRTNREEIIITEDSQLADAVGIGSTCFLIDNHVFATRTLSDRKLWLRALSNLKVILQNIDLDPTSEDISNYRISIRDHIRQISPSDLDADRLHAMPLLRRCAPPCCLRKEALAEPLEERCAPEEREVPNEFDWSPVDTGQENGKPRPTSADDDELQRDDSDSCVDLSI